MWNIVNHKFSLDWSYPTLLPIVYWWHKSHQDQFSIKPKMIYLQIISGFNDWIAVKTGFLLVSWEMVKLVGYYNIGNFMNSFEDLTIRIIHIQNLLKWFIFPIFWISSCQMRKFQFHIDEAYPNGSLRITSSRYRAVSSYPWE